MLILEALVAKETVLDAQNNIDFWQGPLQIYSWFDFVVNAMVSKVMSDVSSFSHCTKTQLANT